MRGCMWEWVRLGWDPSGQDHVRPGGVQGINKEEYKTIEAMNLHWHAKCFRCVACGRKIMGLFMERMGRPVCNNCSRR